MYVSTKWRATLLLSVWGLIASPWVSRGAVVTAGELVVDLRATTLNPASTTWTNQDTTGNTVGNFTTKGGGNLSVAGIGSVSQALFVNTVVNNAVVSAQNAPAALLGNSTRSVEVWVYPLATAATSAAVGWGTSGNSLQSSFNFNTGGNGLFSGWNLDTGWNGGLPTDQWLHLAYTYDGTTLRAYTNGVLNKSAAFGPMATAAAKLGVGAARAASADAFKGYIADVRVHTGVLSASAVANNFSEGIYSSFPTITGLSNQTIVAGQPLVLGATIGGFPQPALQWRSNNIALAGQTNASLAFGSVQFSQNGTVYSLVATNLAGKVTNSMTLTVIVTPNIQGLNSLAVPVGNDVTLAATVSGVPTPALRWWRNNTALNDGPTGNGSTLAGSASNVLNLTNAQAADSGSYSLVASNTAGSVTNSLTLTVSATDVAPELVGPIDQTVVQGSNALFSASVAGLPFPTLQWRLNGVNLSGATNQSLNLTNVQYTQNGHVYSLVASNVAGQKTNSATLTVLVTPTITQSPTNVSVLSGATAGFQVVASGVPAVRYQWRRNGNPIPNATNATYSLVGVTGANNGDLFSVIVSNQVSAVTSSNALLTVLSPMTGVFLPTNNASGISIDQQLRIVFSTPPKIGAGKLYVREVGTDALLATVDTAQFQTFSLWSATITNAAIRSVQGASYYYMPIAIYGNEAWITLLPTQRFAYNKSYYVTCDAGLFRDAANASFPAITSSNTWRFTTKSSGPATPTTSGGLTQLVVGHDGAGDFATLQGAADWVPQNNTLLRTITIRPGVYRDNTTFAQSRNNVRIVGGGEDWADVQLFYPYPAFSGANDRSAGTLRIESSDVYVRNLTIDTASYLTYNGVAWAGPINTLYTTGRRLIFDRVLIKGGQDTLYANSGVAYFNRCEVWGGVDFIYGGALGVFDNCDIVEIRNTGAPITAPSTSADAPHGFVFLNSRFPRALVANGYPYDVNTSSTTFMRPWRQDGATAIINCQLAAQLTTKGWGEWVGAEGAKEVTCRAREYGSTLIGGGAAPTVAQRQTAGAYWLNTYDPDYNPATDQPLDADLAPSTGTGNRLPVTVNPADYTLDAIFGHAYFNLGSWRPTILPSLGTQPTNITVTAGANVALASVASGLPTPTYQWRKNGTNLVGQTAATLTLNNVQVVDAGTYSVIVSNTAGTLVSSNALLTVIPAINLTPTNLVMSATGNTLQFSWPADRIGWRLQAQTNAPGAGLTTNWQTIAGSQATNQLSFPIDSAAGSVFFRLAYP